MNLRRLTIAVFILYVLITLSPFIILILHGKAPYFLMPLISLIGFTFALLHAAGREGWTGALRLLALVFGVSLLFESVGVATGLVYGPYHYTSNLGPLFLGLVPYLIPVAWFMMSYPTYVIAERLVPTGWKPWQRLLAVAAVGGVAMTAWDLVMDPFMVASGNWVWDTNGAYFGIPLQNFWGWWLTVFCTIGLYKLISGRRGRPIEVRFDRWAVGAYLVTMVGILLASFSAGKGDLGLIRLFAMLPWGAAGLLKMA